MCDGRDLAILFDGSFDGFLCIIYAYYYQKIVPLYIQTEDNYQQTLDAEEYYIAADESRAARVLKGIRKKISTDAEHYIYNAFLANEDDKFMDMFRYVILGFQVGAGVDDYLQKDFVLRVHRLAKYVGNEAHLLKGFCRFAETDRGVYYCAVSPANNVLPLLAEHFRDRFMNQAWIIHDKKHGLAAVYDGNDYIIADVPQNADVTYADGEEQTQDLWVAFFETIGIKERKNKKLQRNNMPLRLRTHVTEFQKKQYR